MTTLSTSSPQVKNCFVLDSNSKNILIISPDTDVYNIGLSLVGHANKYN